MKKIVLLIALLVSAASCMANNFVKVDGPDLVKPDGSKLFIKGTNLGNWLNPEGYMFSFRKTNSPRMIQDLVCQLAGPDEAAVFWQRFKDNYITRADIDFIAAQGANTIRLPFHYKLFTSEDYMGMNDPEEGFRRIDAAVEWCRANDLYLILDMHDAPGGQTGDNIDDSYAYPWLFKSEKSQLQMCDIWRRIAERYKNEPVILGYELCNEPIAHFFTDKDELNRLLEPLYKRVTGAIREVDANHVILLGGPQWNSNFEPFTDWAFDNNIMYTCHRYGGDATKPAIQSYIDFRDKTGLPMYMGEIGHNTDSWQADFVKVMKENNIGYTFWPYKKVDGSCMNGFAVPDGWQMIVDYSEKPRGSYEEIRDGRPSQSDARRLLDALIEAVKFENCIPQTGYITSMGLK